MGAAEILLGHKRHNKQTCSKVLISIELRQFIENCQIILTSIVMKYFERLILSHILPYVQSQLDPYQFAYRSRRGTVDAIACLLHKLFEHMETAGNYARILFIDFSSAFNTIQRYVMIDKLQKLEVQAALVHWVFNFNRPLCVRVGDNYSHQYLLATRVRLRVVFYFHFCTLCIQMTVGVLIHLPIL